MGGVGWELCEGGGGEACGEVYGGSGGKYMEEWVGKDIVGGGGEVCRGGDGEVCGEICGGSGGCLWGNGWGSIWGEVDGEVGGEGVEKYVWERVGKYAGEVSGEVCGEEGGAVCGGVDKEYVGSGRGCLGLSHTTYDLHSPPTTCTHHCDRPLTPHVSDRPRRP